MESKKYSLNKEDGMKILQVFLWSLSSFVVIFLIDLLPQLDLGTQFMWVLPIANTILVAAKKFIEERK